jgi:hypothetical protein
MEPYLYHTMIFTPPRARVLLDAIRTKPPAFFSYAVHKLFLADDPASDISSADIQTILSACRGTTDLFLAPKGRVLLPLVSAMPLQRLSADLRSLFAGRPVDFDHPLFANITHLCIFPLMRDDTTQWEGVCRIPRLTHLSFHAIKGADVLQGILQSCPNLKVFVNFYFSTSTVGTQRFADVDLAEDLRYVRVRRGFYANDWKLGAYTGRDYWARAEEWVAKRTLGEVNRELNLLSAFFCAITLLSGLRYVVPDE